MPSISKIIAATAFTGLAAAFPQGGFSNSTAGASGNTTAGSVGNNNSTAGSINPLTEALYCPTLNGNVLLSRTGAEFLLNCGTNHFGVIIDVVANSTIFTRQAAIAPADIQDCLLACDSVSACVGTSFNTAARTCTLYQDVGVAYTDANSDFAIRVSNQAPTTVSAGQTLTSSVYSTNVVTISSCAPEVTNCPLNAASVGPVVVTQLVAVASTEYICPTPSVMPASPVACNCAYAASTATVYSTTQVGGHTTVVVVSTATIAVPSPSMTGISTTTIVGSGVPLTTAPVTVKASATTSSGLVQFTGAASNVQAGMGLLAGVAGLAFML